MELNSAFQEVVDNKIAEMRKNPKLVDAALYFVARVYEECGCASLTREVSILQNELINLFVMADYQAASFDHQCILMDSLVCSAIKIDEAYNSLNA